MSQTPGGAGEPVRHMAGAVLPPSVADLAAGPLAEALDRAIKLARASVSARTEQAYADCWFHFSAWCERHGVSHLPAEPAIVGAYLASRAESVGKSSLRVSLAAWPAGGVHHRSLSAWRPRRAGDASRAAEDHHHHPRLPTTREGRPREPHEAIGSLDMWCHQQRLWRECKWMTLRPSSTGSRPLPNRTRRAQPRQG